MEARIAGFIAFDHYTREENKSLLGRKIYQRKFFGYYFIKNKSVLVSLLTINRLWSEPRSPMTPFRAASR